MARRVSEAAAASGGQDFNTFDQHYREVKIALIKKFEADSVLQHAYKRAKKSGLNLDMFKRAIRAKKQDIGQVQQDQKDFAQYCTWLEMPIGSQGSMFSTTPPPEAGAQKRRVFEAEQEGYTAGTKGAEAGECPYKVGTEEQSAWMRGLHGGIAFMEGRAGDEPKQEKVAPRKAGSRRTAANDDSTETRKAGRKTTVRTTTGEKRRVEVPPPVPETSPAMQAAGDGADDRGGDDDGMYDEVPPGVTVQ